MIKANNVIDLALTEFPTFEKEWQSHRDFWGQDEAGLGNDIGALARYAKNEIRMKSSTITRLFEFVEECMTGEPDLKGAIATSFWESLLNTMEVDEVAKVTHIMGEESRKYCKAWNDYTGVQITGL